MIIRKFLSSGVTFLSCPTCMQQRHLLRKQIIIRYFINRLDHIQIYYSRNNPTHYEDMQQRYIDVVCKLLFEQYKGEDFNRIQD